MDFYLCIGFKNLNEILNFMKIEYFLQKKIKMKIEYLTEAGVGIL